MNKTNNLEMAMDKKLPISLNETIILKRFHNPSDELKKNLRNCRLDKVIDEFVVRTSSGYDIHRESYNEIILSTKNPLGIITGFEIKDGKKKLIISKLNTVKLIIEDTYLNDGSVDTIDIIGKIEDVWPVSM